MNKEVLRERLERIGFEIVPDRQVHKTTKLIMSEAEYRKLEKLISEHTAVVERETLTKAHDIFFPYEPNEPCPYCMGEAYSMQHSALTDHLEALNSKEKEQSDG